MRRNGTSTVSRALLHMPCYTAGKHSLGICFRRSAESLVSSLSLQSFPLDCRNITPFMEAVVNSAKLYVGNLSYDTSEASIRTAFEAHGEVASVNLITDRDSGRPKGFGFVEMGSAEEAQKAKAALDGTQMDGRALKVDVAKEQAPKAPRSGGGGYGGGGYGGGGGNRW